MDASMIATLIFAAASSAILTQSLRVEDAFAGAHIIRVLVWVETFVAIFITVSILVSALLQVAVRHYFSINLDFSWTEELSRLLLVWMTYWAAATVQRRKDHIHVSVIYDLVPPFLQTIIHGIVDMIVLAILAIIAITGFQSAWLQMGQTTITLDLPVSIFAVAVPIGCLLMFIYTAADGIRDLLCRQATRN